MANTKRDEELEALLREFQASGIAELHVKTADFDLFLSNDPNATAPGTVTAHSGPAPAPARSAPVAAPASSSSAPAAASAAPAPSAALPAGCVGVVAPYLGTFYRAPKPGEPAFVELGQSVEAGTDLCLVEVMKLFTAVRSETKGVVREVYAVDGQMVEEGQLLFAIEPAA
jgi:acetyl-CoA carboxylase biotin carboxyl carrier protein